jgi:integrase
VQVDRGEAVAPTRLTTREAADDYFAAAEARVATGEMAKRTLDLYRQRWTSHIEPRLGAVRVQSVHAVHVGKLLRELREEGLSSWTLHGVLTAAGAIFNHAVARGWITESPTKRLARGERPRARNQRQVRVLSPEEIGRVITGTTPRWRPLFIAAAHTGARISELLGLQWEDIDWDENTVSISKQLGRDGKLTRTKTERGVRQVGMSAELRRVLRELYVASGQRPRFVFACESGRAPSYRNARRALDGAITAAEIEWDDETHRLSFHCLRHGAVSALIRNGADPVRVARFVGDKVETLLSTYAQEWAAAQGDDLADVLGAALSVSG